MAPPKASPQGRDLQNILANMAELAMGTEKRTGQPAPKVDPAQIRSMHAQAYRNSKNERHAYANFYASRQTFCGDIYCSKMPLEQLTRISIKDLRMEMKHEGKYLLLRLVEPCFKMSGIMTVVEDPEGSVCILSLYNYIEKDSVNVEELLPVGTVLALKEPHYKFTNTNSCVIRCDSPSDVILLERTGLDNGLDIDNLVYAEFFLKGITWKNKLTIPSTAYTYSNITPDNCAEEQARAFKEKRHHDVIGIAALMSKNHYGARVPIGLVSYRAFSCIELGYLEMAFRHAKSMYQHFEAGGNIYPSMLPLGQALYKLRRFEDALKVYTVLQNWPQRHTLDEHIPLSYEACKKRVLEAREGKYTFGGMMAKVKAGTVRMENADYIGPVRLVPLHNSKGVKVVVTKTVEPGTLLMACKAFEIVYQSELKDAASAFMLINFKNNIISLPARSQLVTKIAQRILENPSTAVGLYELETRDSPSGSNGPVKLYADDINQREPIADVDLIHRIVAHNALNPETLDENMLGYKRQSSDSSKEPDAGLWILPSHIKHACCPSAVATFIGDFMFVRAKQHMKPGDEVTISYVEAVASLADRSSELSTRNFSCYCSLCETERAEPKWCATKRAEILTEFGKKFKLGQADDLTVISSIVRGIMETYAAAGSPKIQQMLYLPYTALGAVYLSRDQRPQAAVAFTQALRSLGFTQDHEDYVLTGTGVFPRDILLPLAPMTAIHIYNYYWHADEYGLAEKWYRIAKGLDKILHGGDEYVFKTLYSSFLNTM